MNNKEHQNIIKKALKKNNGMSLSDMQRELPLTRDNVRISVAFLLGSKGIVEQIYGRSKVYYLSNK